MGVSRRRQPWWSVSSAFDTVSNFVNVYRLWSDGQLDMTRHIAGSCVDVQGPCVMVPGTCPTDIDRNGDTGINDFLTLLGGWGECK